MKNKLIFYKRVRSCNQINPKSGQVRGNQVISDNELHFAGYTAFGSFSWDLKKLKSPMVF